MSLLSHARVIAMFRRVGEITLTTTADMISGNHGPGSDKWLHATVRDESAGPCVYLWVDEPPHSAPEIVYVGKAGTSLALRCRQHAQGFRGAGRGKAHATFLIHKIRAGSRIGIYGLWPDAVPFAGHMIPSHSAVEDWLLTVIEPKPTRTADADRQAL